MFLSIHITLYHFQWLLAAWNVFWHVKESFLCIMLPPMNRFLNFIGHSIDGKTQKITESKCRYVSLQLPFIKASIWKELINICERQTYQLTKLMHHHEAHEND